MGPLAPVNRPPKGLSQGPFETREGSRADRKPRMKMHLEPAAGVFIASEGDKPRSPAISLWRRVPVCAYYLAGLGMLVSSLSSLSSVIPLTGLTMAEGHTLLSVDYEIFGKVQGVFFRKYTQARQEYSFLEGKETLRSSSFYNIKLISTLKDIRIASRIRLKVKSWDW
ncbi:acylphosphatase-1 isoform X4 [Trichosurus vulpecula]|uniref:acylphosphatase-1 isoform X4 n=1 Tax=Trichosurus vulpecula TaxID=9337 RepID=UPI00186B33A0|nr:acylphosphatase-1 isoform X4 [Trichosurus vulpecula]